MQVEKSVARGSGGIYLWDPTTPRGVWFGFPSLPGQRARDFFVLPDYPNPTATLAGAAPGGEDGAGMSTLPWIPSIMSLQVARTNEPRSKE